MRYSQSIVAIIFAILSCSHSANAGMKALVKAKCAYLLTEARLSLAGQPKAAISELKIELENILTSPSDDATQVTKSTSAIEAKLATLNTSSQIKLLRSVNSIGDWGGTTLFSYHQKLNAVPVGKFEVVDQIKNWAIERLTNLKSIDSLLALSDIFEQFDRYESWDKIYAILSGPEIPYRIRHEAVFLIVSRLKSHADNLSRGLRRGLYGRHINYYEYTDGLRIPLDSENKIAEDKYYSASKNLQKLGDLYVEQARANSSLTK
jgi:ribosome recycling factor